MRAAIFTCLTEYVSVLGRVGRLATTLHGNLRSLVPRFGGTSAIVRAPVATKGSRGQVLVRLLRAREGGILDFLVALFQLWPTDTIFIFLFAKSRLG